MDESDVMSSEVGSQFIHQVLIARVFPLAEESCRFGENNEVIVLKKDLERFHDLHDLIDTINVQSFRENFAFVSVEAVGSALVIDLEESFLLSDPLRAKVKGRIHHRIEVVWIEIRTRTVGHVGIRAAGMRESKKVPHFVQDHRLKIGLHSIDEEVLVVYLHHRAVHGRIGLSCNGLDAKTRLRYVLAIVSPVRHFIDPDIIRELIISSDVGLRAEERGRVARGRHLRRSSGTIAIDGGSFTGIKKIIPSGHRVGHRGGIVRAKITIVKCYGNRFGEPATFESAGLVGWDIAHFSEGTHPRLTGNSAARVNYKNHPQT